MKESLRPPQALAPVESPSVAPGTGSAAGARALNQLYSIIDALPILVSYVDADQRYQLNNAAYEKWYGVPVETLKGRHLQEVLGDGYARVRPRIEAVLRGEAQSFDLFWQESGNSRSLHFNFVPDRNADGEVLGFFAISNDVTEHLQTKEQLRLSETRYRTLVENTKDWIWEMGLDGRHTYSNRQIEEILGYARDEFAGLSLDQLIHPEDMKNVEARLPSLIADKRGWERWVLRFRQKDGGYRYLESNAHPILDASGVVVGFRGVDRDVTQRTRIEEQLRLSEARLKEAQRIAKIGSWERNLTDDTGWWSEESYRLFGVNPEDIKIQRDIILQRIHPEDRERVRAAMEQAINHHEPYSFDARIVLPDGTERIIDARGQMIFDDEGRPTRVAGTTYDITERKQAEEQLRLSEARLNEAQRIAKIGSWERSLIDDTRWWSDEHYRLFGLDPHEYELTRDTIFDRIHPEDRERARNIMEKALESRQPCSFDARIVRPDGTQRTIEARGQMVFDDEGRPIRITGTTHDITERKHAEEQLRLSEARLREAQRIGKTGCWELDLRTKELWWSSECYRIFGAEPGELEIGLEGFMASIHPDDRQRVMAARERSIQQQEPYEAEYRIITEDGTEKSMYARGELVSDEEGQPVRVLGTVLDITERKRAEEEIKEILTRLEALTRAAFDGVALVEDGRYLEVSDRFASKLGYAPDELSGKPIAETVTPSSLQTIHQHTEDKGDSAYEMVLRRKNGSTFPVEVRGASVTYEGRAARVGAIRDISDRVVLERRVLSIQERERHNIGRDLHDGVGQTLTGVSLGLETLRHKLENERSPHVQSLQDLTTMVQRTISEVRHLARVLAPSLSVKGFPSALSALGAEISEHSTVAFRLSCPSGMAFGDDETVLHLYRLVQEAVNNAIRHAEPKSIEVSCWRERDTIHVEVLDDGMGIKSEQERGQGVGLNNMRQRADVLGGTLRVTSRPEGGTRVHCAYPFPKAFEEVTPQRDPIVA